MFLTALPTTNPSLYVHECVHYKCSSFSYVESDLNSLGVTVLQSYVNSFQYVVFPSTV